MQELRDPTVFVVRHGATRFNSDSDEESRLKGTKFDLPLTDEGHEEAEVAAQWISQFDIGDLKHSDMLRSTETTRHIEKATGAKSEKAEGLDPWDVGYLSGHTRADAQRHIEYYIRNASKAVPEGEPYQDFFDAYADALAAELKAAERDHNSPTFKPHVLVTHSCNVMATQAIIDGQDPKFHSETAGEKPGQITKLSKKAGKWKMADVDLSGPGSR